jgi:hypothetical protein
MIQSNYNNNQTPTLLPQTLVWGSFKANDSQMPTLIFSNTLKLNFTGLTENTAYNWTVKVQKGLPNASALDGNNFTTGAGQTTKSLNVYLTAGVYNVGNTYYFGLAQAVTGGDEGIQFDFKIDNRITLDTGGGPISPQLLNQAFSYSGQNFNVITNRFLDELSLEKTNLTVFTNAKIPTNLAVQNYVDSLNAQNVKLTENQTIAGIKTFTSPVVGVEPTAGNHLTTRNFVDFDNLVLSQAQTIRARFVSNSLTQQSWQRNGTKIELESLNYYARLNINPTLYLIPTLSADMIASGSTALINLGVNSSSLTITNTTSGVLVQDGAFNFVSASSMFINTSSNFYSDNFAWFAWVNFGTQNGAIAGNQGATRGTKLVRQPDGRVQFFSADGVNNAALLTCKTASAVPNNTNLFVAGVQELGVGTKLYIGNATTNTFGLDGQVNVAMTSYTPNNAVSIGQSSANVEYANFRVFNFLVVNEAMTLQQLRSYFNFTRKNYI